MQTSRLIQIFSRNDAKLIGRDRFLVSMFAFIIVIVLALRYGLPWLNTYLIDAGVMPGERVTQSLAEFYPLIVAFFALFQGTLISGTIFGFTLLDEKDDDTIKAMLVTPISLKNYALYRFGIPVLLAFLIVLLMIWGIGQAPVPVFPAICLAIGASLNAAIVALFYGIVAENKVQGFAMSKFVSTVGLTILFGWFVAPPWQWLFSIYPPFLVCKAYWMVLEGNPSWWVALIAGILGQMGLIYWMAKRFNKVAYR